MKLAFLFPGQGSQAPGMGQFLFENFETAKRTFEEASDAISVDMKALCFKSDEKTLALTENTQPALLTVSIATARVLQSETALRPALTAGHSIGEYAAMVTSEALAFSDAVKAVRLRGQAMQSAVPLGQGGMAAVMGLDETEVRMLCDWIAKSSGQTPISPANFNCPGQIVISGKASAIEYATKNLKPEEIFPNQMSGQTKRIKLIPLQVSAPFHCALMQPAEEKMRLALTGTNFQDAKIPVLQNFTAQIHSKKEELRENLIRQVSAPVLWMQSMKILLDFGVETSIECGHGKVLAGLAKKIDSEKLRVLNVNSIEDLKALESLA
jgi:[acyl-carrier-protein] S-malonyltransferase